MNPSNRRVIRLTRAGFAKVFDSIFFLDYIFQVLFEKTTISGSKPDNFFIQQKTSVSIAVYAVYVNSSEEAATILFNVGNLESLGFFPIVVNTGSYPVGYKFEHKRSNFGRDLGSLSWAISNISWAEFINLREFLFINDSIVWLEGGLLQTINKARGCTSQVTGTTISNQGENHIQSYFYHIKNPTESILNNFVTGTFRYKRTTIKFGEKRISRSLIKEGITIEAIFPEDFLRKMAPKFATIYGSDWDKLEKLIEDDVPLNPTIHYWPVLISEGLFFKRNLERNPAGFQEKPHPQLFPKCSE